MVPQWCEICGTLVEDVEPCRLRGQYLIMACSNCRQCFPKRTKAQWGVQEWKFFWDLGNSPVPISGRGGVKRIHYVNLTPTQVVWMRAAGYLMFQEVKEDESNRE